MGRDVVAGAALIAVGALYAGYAAWDLPLGSLRRMGPGLFPVGLGALLALFGACIAVPAIGRDAALPTMNARAIAAVGRQRDRVVVAERGEDRQQVGRGDEDAQQAERLGRVEAR